MNENEIKMVLPCKCPECGKDIVIKMTVPTPEITDIMKSEDVEEKIKKMINEQEDDTTEKPTTK